jgi:hypothetical protein
MQPDRTSKIIACPLRAPTRIRGRPILTNGSGAGAHRRGPCLARGSASVGLGQVQTAPTSFSRGPGQARASSGTT